MSKTWRTNIGLRLTDEDGAWFEDQCEEQCRPYANYIEYLVIQERRRCREKVLNELVAEAQEQGFYDSLDPGISEGRAMCEELNDSSEGET